MKAEKPDTVWRYGKPVEPCCYLFPYGEAVYLIEGVFAVCLDGLTFLRICEHEYKWQTTNRREH